MQDQGAASKGPPVGLRSPPLFGGAGPPDKTKRPLPEAYHIGDDVAPPWATALQQGIDSLGKGQQDQLQALQRNSEAIRGIADKVQVLETRQDTTLERTAALELRISSMEQELRDIRSRSPSATSGVSPSPSPRDGRSGQTHDDWQIVLGGWREAKREDIETEVRAWFQRAQCEGLLQAMYCSSVRSNTCRVDLLYTQDTMSDRRKIQGMCVWKRFVVLQDRASSKASLEMSIGQNVTAARRNELASEP